MHLKLWFKRAVYVLLFISIFIFLVIFSTLQLSPHIQAVHQISSDSAQENKNTARRILHTLKSKKQPINLSVSQKELNGLSALGHRAIPRLTSDIALFNQVALINISLELPLPRMIKYLNIEATLLASTQGLDFDTVYLGAIPIPGNWLVTVFEWLTNAYIKEEFGTSLIEMVKKVDINSEQISVKVLLMEDLAKQKQDTKEGLFALRDQLALYGDVEVIKFYHQALAKFSASKQVNTSFSHYLGFMFGLAQQRSIDELGFSAVEENQAALTALVIYFGSNKFELLVGNVSELSPKQTRHKIMQQSRSTLRERVDIQKHYIYSVALQLFGSSQASDAIGELKEFLDANKGGSGFSFADLMADRAGTRLAMLATRSEHSAKRVQNILANTLDESQLLPALIGLPEGVSQQAFEQHYQHIQSNTYNAMLAVIDERLLKLAVYQTR
jgi:hypothetical protein